MKSQGANLFIGRKDLNETLQMFFLSRQTLKMYFCSGKNDYLLTRYDFNFSQMPATQELRQTLQLTPSPMPTRVRESNPETLDQGFR